MQRTAILASHDAPAMSSSEHIHLSDLWCGTLCLSSQYGDILTVQYCNCQLYQRGGLMMHSEVSCEVWEYAL